MLMLLNDRTPIEQFDVVGVFDFNDQIEALDAYRQIAMDNRPDLKAAVQAVEKAETDYKLAVANGRPIRRLALTWGEILRSTFILAWGGHPVTDFRPQSGEQAAYED